MRGRVRPDRDGLRHPAPAAAAAAARGVRAAAAAAAVAAAAAAAAAAASVGARRARGVDAEAGREPREPRRAPPVKGGLRRPRSRRGARGRAHTSPRQKETNQQTTQHATPQACARARLDCIRVQLPAVPCVTRAPRRRVHRLRDEAARRAAGGGGDCQLLHAAVARPLRAGANARGRGRRRKRAAPAPQAWAPRAAGRARAPALRARPPAPRAPGGRGGAP